MRNKVVGIERADEHTLVAYGILDDDIYGLELTVSIGFPERRILSAQGRFKRYTTPECPKAAAALQGAVGLHIGEEGFSRAVSKAVGRKGCRHFANLLLECCATAQEAAKGLFGESELTPEIQEAAGKPEKKTSSVEAAGPRAEAGREAGTPTDDPADAQDHRKQGGQLIIDLHLHTSPASPCSVVSVESHIEVAKRIGLDGLCLTDHNYMWDRGRVEALRQKHGFLVLGGSEITTDQGDVLVFGFERRIQGIIRIEELRRMVQEAKGFMIVAHPFRGFLTFGIGKLGLSPEQAAERPVFRCVDAVEVLNGRVTEEENRFASVVAERLGLPATGGSDSHEISETGVYATRFSASISNERQLVDALRSGDYRPVAFRRERGL